MNKQFDELSKSLAEDVSRREALRRFAWGLGGVLIAAVGLKRSASADVRTCTVSGNCREFEQCCGGFCIPKLDNNNCGYCGRVCSTDTTCTVQMETYTDRGGRKHNHKVYRCLS
jgi:hypothetical protein